MTILKLMLLSILRRQTPRHCIKTVCMPLLASLTIFTVILLLRSELIICSRGGESYSQPIYSASVPTVCTEDSCRLEYVAQLHRRNVHPIPAIRHIILKSESVSEHLAEQLRTWYRIHPDWTFVLWRDQDLETFVSTHFPGSFTKYMSLPNEIMKVGLVRYMILYKYGGVYADIDYTLVRSLNKYRRFHAVITREPEAHSLEFLGMTWPPKLMASPAFMMATPGHTFFHYAMLAFGARDTKTVLEYGGPLGLTDTVHKYRTIFPRARNSMETVYVPPSYSFYPYPENRIRNSKSTYLDLRFKKLHNFCKLLAESYEAKWREARQHHELREFCQDVNNMDSITDKSQPIVAIHDLVKSGATYENADRSYIDVTRDVKSIIPGLKFGKDL